MKGFLAILLFCWSFKLSASDSTKVWEDLIKDFKTSTLTVKWLNPPKAKIIFNDVEVIDARVDTSHLGLFTPGTDFFKPTKLIFTDKEPLSFVLKNKLTSIQNGDKACIIIIRDFWINDTKTKKNNTDKRSVKEIRTSKVTLKLDIFLKQIDGYKPLCRIDTIIWSSKVIAKSTYDLFENALETINSEVLKATEDVAILRRKSENKQTIVNQYLKYNPLLTLKKVTNEKGLYYSYDQFKNKQAIIEQFNVYEYGNDQLLLYGINDKGEQFLKHDVWGLFDGENYYIMQNGILFKLYFYGKAVYWMGLKQFNLVPLNVPFKLPILDNYGIRGSVNLTPNNKTKLSPNLLNLDTGYEY